MYGPKIKDPICCNSCMVLSMFWQSFIFSARHQLDTWTLAPPPAKDTLSYYMWVLLRVLGQGLNQSARIFFIRFYSGCYAILTSPPKGRNSCLWLQSRSVFSSVGVVLMSCKINFHVVRSALQYSACKI